MLRIEGVDYYGTCRPAGDTARDYLEFYPLDFRTLAVAVGDTTADNEDTAFMNMAVRAFLREFAGTHRDPAHLVEALNRTACEICPGNFWATLFYTVIDPPHRQLRYVNAGHEPAVLVRVGSGKVELLGNTGTVVGLTARASYRQRAVRLEPGDVFIVLTDGIVDTDIVPRIVFENPRARARDLARWILDATDGRTQDDDRTVSVVRMLSAAERPLFEASADELALAAA